MLKVYNLLSICLESFSSGKLVFENQELSVDVSVDWEHLTGFALSIWFFFSKHQKLHNTQIRHWIKKTLTIFPETCPDIMRHLFFHTKNINLASRIYLDRCCFQPLLFGRGVVENFDYCFVAEIYYLLNHEKYSFTDVQVPFFFLYLSASNVFVLKPPSVDGLGIWSATHIYN